jgi:hypothetical protein
VYAIHLSGNKRVAEDDLQTDSTSSGFRVVTHSKQFLRDYTPHCRVEVIGGLRVIGTAEGLGNCAAHLFRNSSE